MDQICLAISLIGDTSHWDNANQIFTPLASSHVYFGAVQIKCRPITHADVESSDREFATQSANLNEMGNKY